MAAAAGATVISVNTERGARFGAKHLELIGRASEVLPALLAVVE